MGFAVFLHSIHIALMLMLKVHIDGLKKVFDENYFAKQEDLQTAHKAGVANLIENNRQMNV